MAKGLLTGFGKTDLTFVNEISEGLDDWLKQLTGNSNNDYKVKEPPLRLHH